MKKLLIIMTIMILSGCSLPKNEKKIVIDKIAPNENRFSGSDFLFGKGSVTKTTTVYYLVAEDGTVCEVGMTKYFKVKIGQKYACDWQKK